VWYHAASLKAHAIHNNFMYRLQLPPLHNPNSEDKENKNKKRIKIGN
jgi:hypothetical protein